MYEVRMVNRPDLKSDLVLNELSYLMFLKQKKKTGVIKARVCADGRPQREFIGKEERSVPTMSIYALMASCGISEIEERKVVICNILGVFLQSYWPEDKPMYLKFEGKMVDILCEIDPTIKEFIIEIRDKRKLMYGQLNKAVYGISLVQYCSTRKLLVKL